MPSVVVLTCVFVVWMHFLTLVTAALLEEESSTLHHEEAFAQTATKKWRSLKKKEIPQITTESRVAAAQYSLSQLVPGKTNIFSWTGTRDTNNKIYLDYVGILLII